MKAVMALGPLLIAAAAGVAAGGANPIPEEALSAGVYTIARFHAEACSSPIPVLSHRENERFLRGRHHFQQRWIRFPSIRGDWGLGLPEIVSGSAALLYDGRARNVTDAILWHGGEATRSREAFRRMGNADREALLKHADSI